MSIFTSEEAEDQDIMALTKDLEDIDVQSLLDQAQDLSNRFRNRWECDVTRRGEAAAGDEGVPGSGLYESIVESVDLALALVDESLRIVWANRRFDEAFASSQSSCVGGRLVKIIRNDRLESVVRRAMTDSEPVREEELNLRTSDREERQFLLAVSRVEPGLSTESYLLALDEITRWRRRQFQVMEAGRLLFISWARPAAISPIEVTRWRP